MTTDIIRNALLWCWIINWGLLLWWFLIFLFAHDRMYKLHGKWFKISVEQFDAIHYSGMAIFKIAVFVFNFVPWIALTIAG